MSNVSSWSQTAASNNASPPNGAPEGMSPASINDCMREIMAALAKWYAGLKGALVTTGSSNAYALSTGSSHASLSVIGLVVFRANHTNTGAATLAVDGLTAKSLRHRGTSLAANALIQDDMYAFIYNPTDDAFDMIGSPAAINQLVAGGLTYPTADGSSGQVISTNGAGLLSFSTVSANISYSARTSNTILAAGDKSTLINITANSFTQTLTAAATLGAGWYCYYKNSGTGLVTLDPNGSETINGATTLVIGTGSTVLIICDGSNFQVVWGEHSGDDYATATTGNGYGSTNTAVRRFTSSATSGGSVTYADSAGNGASFTINTAGLYEIYRTDPRGTSNPMTMGVSVNSAQLTTSISSITAANRLAIGFSNSASGPVSVTRIVRLAVGDVIRPHDDPAAPSTNADALSYMSVKKIGN